MIFFLLVSLRVKLLAELYLKKMTKNLPAVEHVGVVLVGMSVEISTIDYHHGEL